MDEIFGYFPPVANPPSKLPLLTLLKQGRAFGVGVVLATQNPVDLDYKGLSNTGTWFIGRLQTERDKDRVLEGLEGVAAGSGQKFDRQEMEQVLAGLGSRIFVLNNTHDDAPEVFESRWAMSYLRGPLTRVQIKTLMDPVKVQPTTSAAIPTATVATPQPAMPGSQKQAPVLPPDVTQCFIPIRSSSASNAKLVYLPTVFGAAEISYSASKRVEMTEQLTLLASITDGPVAVDWGQAQQLEVPINDLEKGPQPEAEFADVPPAGTKTRNYESWKKDIASWIYRNRKLELMESPRLKIVSNPGESERDFRVRLQQLAREQRDAEVEKLRNRYAPKIAQLEEKKRRAEHAVAREAEQAKGQKLQTAISVGATLLSSFMGRKTLSMTTLGRATTAARGVGRSMKESEDVDRAQETVETMSQRILELDAQFKADVEMLDRSFDPQTEPLEKVSLKPTKSNIDIKLVTFAWAPYWRDTRGQVTPAW
jgi:hypothetical protein